MTPMMPQKKQRLILVVIIFISMSLGVTFLLIFFRDNMVYFYTPSEIPIHHDKQRLLRVGGLVVKNSVIYDTDQIQKVSFKVTDNQTTVTINYQGSLPDLFREGQGVVVEGHIQMNGTIKANRVLAKHDENYVPPEVKKGLDNADKQKLQQSLKP